MRRVAHTEGPSLFGWCQAGQHEQCRREFVDSTKTRRMCGCEKRGCPCAERRNE